VRDARVLRLMRRCVGVVRPIDPNDGEAPRKIGNFQSVWVLSASALFYHVTKLMGYGEMSVSLHCATFADC
jgi:hypothetical protein